MKVRALPVDPGPAAWNDILPQAPEFPSLDQDLSYDVVVVGAGFAGLAAAQRLVDQSGLSVALVEARGIAQGPAGRNSGFMIDLPHELNSEGYTGAQGAQIREIQLNRMGISYAAELAKRYQMPQAVFDACGRVTGAATESGMRHLKDYQQQLNTLDEPSRWIEAAELMDMTGTGFYQRGLFTPGAAVIQPAAYVRALAMGLSRQAQIYENTPVIGFESTSKGWTLTTPRGQLKARQVVLAVNGHLQSFGFFARRFLHVFTYASMTQAMTPEQIACLGGQPDWGMLPADPMGTTVRRVSDYLGSGDRIIIRNHATLNPSIQASSSDMTRAARMQDQSFKNRFPMLDDVRFEHRWGGRLCLSLNSTHAFGEIQPGLFSACCQNGLGTAKGMLSGMLAADLMVQGPDAPGVQDFLAMPQPKALPPRPFLDVGARVTMRYKEYKAGIEL